MTDKEIDSLFNEFLASAPHSVPFDASVPNSQATVLVSIVANNAPVLAEKWHLPAPRADLSERIDNDTVQSEDIDIAFATTWSLTICGYFLAQFFCTRGFNPTPVNFDELQQACRDNQDRPVEDWLEPGLKQLAARCQKHLADGYAHQDHLHGLLKAGQIDRETVDDLAERAVLAGIFVWQMSDSVRLRSN